MEPNLYEVNPMFHLQRSSLPACGVITEKTVKCWSWTFLMQDTDSYKLSTTVHLSRQPANIQ